MRLSDLIRMAIRNLLVRRWRSILNLTGIVIGCVVVILTFAATRGIEDGLYALLDSSDAMKLMYLQPNYNVAPEIPDDVGVVEGEMSDERREAIRTRLRKEWQWKHGTESLLDAELTNKLRTHPHIVEIVPNGSIPVEIEMDGKVSRLSCEGFSAFDRRLAQRIMAGVMPGPDDDEKILLSEFAAYRLGFPAEVQVKGLLGRKIRLRYRSGGRSDSTLLYLLKGSDAKDLALSDQLSILGSVKTLAEDLDKTSLTPEQIVVLQRGLRSVFEESKPEVALTREFEICGIVKMPGQYEYSMIPNFGGERNWDLAVHYAVLNRMAESVETEKRSMYQYGATVRVDHLKNLKDVEAYAQKLGLHAHSASWLLENISKQLSVARWGVAAVGIFVLCVAAFSISNTMAISVLERTAELGIMKSLGARDSQVIGMIIWEGGVTGAVGALISIATAFLLSTTTAFFVRKYVSYRIGETYNGGIFVYSWVDLLLVFLVATSVCILASILPSRRAARLDPIQAMRGASD